MDLSFEPEYEVFRHEVRDFLTANIDKSPRSTAMRSSESLEWQKLLIANGYTARTIPKEFGGFGAAPNIIQSRIIAEEFAEARANPGLGGQVPVHPGAQGLAAGYRGAGAGGGGAAGSHLGHRPGAKQSRCCGALEVAGQEQAGLCTHGGPRDPR